MDFNKLLANNNENENENKSTSSFNRLLNELNKSHRSNSENNNLVKNLELSNNLFKVDAYNTNNKLDNKTIKVTRPSLVMYNITVDNNTPVDLVALAQRINPPFEKHVLGNNGIVMQVTKVTGLTGRFKPAFTITNTYNRTGNTSEKIFALDFYIKVKLGGEIVNATFTLFKNGKIKMSGGYLSQDKENVNNDYYFEAQPEMIREYIVNTYTDGQAFLRKNFKFNNVVGDFRINKGFNLSAMAEAALGNISYEPELSRLLKLKYKGYNYTFSTTGLVQIQGLKEQDDLNKAYLAAIEFINNMSDIHKKKPGHRKLYKNRNAPEGRVKKQKVLNITAPAPNVSRRGTSCPVDRRPKPYSIQGTCPKEGCYVKPNPQGQPCCYKIPKNTKYSEKKVQNAFNKANVKVPVKVQRVFNFGQNTNNKANNTTHAGANYITVKRNAVVGLKIGTRQCTRYTKVALVDIARRLGITVKSTISKPALCELIGARAHNVTNTNNSFGNKAVTFSNGARTYVVTGASPDLLRIGDRFAKTYKRAVLFRFATKLGIHPNLKASVPVMCKLIFDAVQAKRPKTPVPSPQVNKVETPVNKAALLQRALRKLRLTNELIKNDIRAMYGANNVPNINWKAKNMHGIIDASFTRNYGYGKVVFGKGGMPKRSSIQEIKKKLVNRWKVQDKNVAAAPKKKVQKPRNVIQEEL